MKFGGLLNVIEQGVVFQYIDTDNKLYVNVSKSSIINTNCYNELLELNVVELIIAREERFDYIIKLK